MKYISERHTITSKSKQDARRDRKSARAVESPLTRAAVPNRIRRDSSLCRLQVFSGDRGRFHLDSLLSVRASAFDWRCMLTSEHNPIRLAILDSMSSFRARHCLALQNWPIRLCHSHQFSKGGGGKIDPVRKQLTWC